MKTIKDLADSPSMKTIRALTDDPTMKLVRALTDDPTMKTIRALTDDPTMKMVRALADNPMMQSIEKITDKHQRFLRGLRQTGNLGGLAEIAGRMQNQPAFSTAVAAKVDALQTAIDEFDTADENGHLVVEKHFDELIVDLLDQLEKAVEKIEFRSVVAYVGWLIPILLALYLFQISSTQTEEAKEEAYREHTDITNGISEHENEAREGSLLILDRLTELEEKIDELSESKNAFEGTFYVVIRPVPLNVEQRYHGGYISWLLPGQEVELIERSGKWIRVIAYDFVTGTTHIGWVMKKYLRRIR